MASLSMAAAVPAGTPFDISPGLPIPTKAIHARSTSRQSRLAPLSTFTFNPGAMENTNNEHRAGPGHAENEDTADVDPPIRKAPPRLPAFSFNPGAAMETGSGSSSPSHPILEEMAQKTSRHTSKSAALPAFSFNPNGGEPATTPSPTKSSFTLDPPTSARSTGHRRGASEFIGAGEVAETSSAPVGISPQKSSLGPPVTGHGPPRFSHQHRRSQAVSITEIETSDLIKANAVAKHRAGSMPSTPTDVPSNDHCSQAGQPVSSLLERTSPPSPHRRSSATGARPRVGFSDTIDVIPRPLSMISSETEGSTSTVRGNHSLTGSITSWGSPAPRSTPSPDPNESGPARRPKTADAVGSSPQMVLPMEDSLHKYSLLKRPLSASDSTSFFASSGSPASKKRFWFSAGGSNETFSNATPKHTSVIEGTGPVTSLTPFAPAEPMTLVHVRPKTSPERKVGIKKRKVRSIAGAIFSRKARSRGAQSRGRRTPTPPLSRSFTNEVADAVFDDDNTVVIRNPPASVQRPPLGPPLNTNLPIPDHPSSCNDDAGDGRVTSPVLDLDAALGPFGSEEKLPQTGFAAARGRMHSSMGRGVPDAFGVMHRRAESAPQMPPVNRSTFGMHRLGSNTSVAEDVFDEEEEDDFLAEENKPRAESDPTSEQSAMQETSAQPVEANNIERGGRATCSPSPSGLSITVGVLDGIGIVDTEEDITQESARSSGSTLTAPAMPDSETKHATSSPMAFAYPTPPTSYASSGEGRSASSSAIPSPDADHINFDHYRRSSRHLGEASLDPAPRASTEDVPSLCDSVSTGNTPRVSSGAATWSSTDQCSSSFSAASSSRTPRTQQAWKRASLASLNKLIPGSSHGEKSRLRFEESAEHEQEGNERAKKKGNRISRLMNFWRSKEKETK